ncbi:(2Fe-2S)-binding protein [Luteimonas sp. Y-2-2-4F]|nr:2Fe-2S iron-sulfur cluster-binding protein [Luteimonas sp. Y-2-2-4F]MCD9031638.1 (2Fe-2S)-binding protein [Luteimonas sp. Y-2-2-4F]MCD9031787.1 (2Fe-2S)-binding protein [Luteimonas sp. Y-2-2-4F]
MPAATVRLAVDGREVAVRAGSSVAAAVAIAGAGFRTSVGGEPRAPLCGMGVCFECRVTIDGGAQRRACLTTAADGMQVRTCG